MLDHLHPESPQFAYGCVEVVQRFGRSFSQTSNTDERWSLAECGLCETDWQKVRHWARTCRAESVPSANGRAAGVMLLVLGSAVARSLERDEALWRSVADSCSPALQREFFSNADYPVEEVREALSEACQALGLRHQLNLPGKHRYWRTVLLQFGFSARVGATRLPFWLAGYSIPETVTALLTEGSENSSTQFQELWRDLERWNRRFDDTSVEARLRKNPWYPAESHGLLRDGLAADRDRDAYPQHRAEDEDANPTVFAPPRLHETTLDLNLSNYLPSEIANAPGVVIRLHVDGIGWRRLVRNDEGRLQMDEGPLRVLVSDALEKPSREVRVVGGGGTLYRERFAFWTDEDDLILFRGQAGGRVHDLARFVPEAGCPYAVVARSDVQLKTALGWIESSERGDEWCLYRFPQGLPLGLTASVEDSLLWYPGEAPTTRPTLQGAAVCVRELSATHLQLTAHMPLGWTSERFRFGGTRFTGSNGTLEVSPSFQYEGKLVHATVSRGNERRAVEIRAGKIGAAAAGAAFQDTDGIWRELRADRPLDAGQIEGRTLAIRWDTHHADDPWLMLGEQPLRPDPHASRRQRFTAMGEPLELRFGLMNEDRAARFTLSPAVYSTGLLAEIIEVEDLYLIRLREPLELADEIRIWVWEQGCALPRLLPVDEVQAHNDRQTFSILKLSVSQPIGWALSLDGCWRGTGFHSEPFSESWTSISNWWCDVIADCNMWQEIASVFRWWRFPVLMEPFRTTAQEQASQHPFRTLRAWTEPLLPPAMMLTTIEEPYISPLRMLLWNYKPSEQECAELWAIHEQQILDCFSSGQLSPATALLLRSHPVLLARIVCEVLWIKEREEEALLPIVFTQTLFHRRRDPVALMNLEAKYGRFFGIAATFFQRHAGYCNQVIGGEDHDALRLAALSELRSWSDPIPLDDMYFHDFIVRPAEALFEQQPCDSTRLKIAIARSPACCAYLVSHLLRVKGINGRL